MFDLTSHDPKIIKIKCFDLEKTIFCCDKDQNDEEEDLIAEGEWDMSQLGECENYEFEDKIELEHEGASAGHIRIRMKFLQDDVKIAKEIKTKTAKDKQEAEQTKFYQQFSENFHVTKKPKSTVPKNVLGQNQNMYNYSYPQFFSEGQFNMNQGGPYSINQKMQPYPQTSFNHF